MATTSSATNKKASFRLKPEMIEQLITCLHQYKTAMSYKNLEFDVDKPIQYKDLRLKMASLFENENVSLFGSVNPLLPPENFDSLPKDEQSKPNVAGGGQQDNIFSNKSSSDLEEPTPKRIKSSCVPQLVDDKRKHLEKRLSAAQRDNLLVKEAKDDAQFKKDLCQAIRESTASFSESIKEISNSMTGIGMEYVDQLNCYQKLFCSRIKIFGHGNGLPPIRGTTFKQYASDKFLPFLGQKLRDVKRLDVVFDVYVKDSLKSTARSHRGEGSRKRVKDNYIVPANWNSFLRHSGNKTELFSYLANFSHQNLKNGEKSFAITIGSEVLTLPPQDTSIISPCNHEEADSRMYLHLYDAITRQNMQNAVIKTVDTDVMVLGVAAVVRIRNLKLYIAFGSGKTFRYINGEENCHGYLEFI
eukprot:gene13119-14467_t